MKLLFVDDGSTDNTAAVLKEYQKTCPQLKIITHEKNKGASDSYNRCIAEATGDFIAIIDSGNQYLPHPIFDVLAQVDGEYDIYYYKMLTKHGFPICEKRTVRYTWCGQFKIIRRSFIGDAVFTTRKDFAGD